MRFPRNVKIFRGGIDAAPFAGLFFVLVLLLMLFHSHIFFPGVPIQLSAETEDLEVTPRSISVRRSGELQLLGEPLASEGLEKEIKLRAQAGTLPKRIILDAERGADELLVQRVENAITDAGIAIKIPGSRLELPDDAGFAGAANPVVVVAVNLHGQIFFQHQLLKEEQLQQRLSIAVERAAGPVKLLLQADKMVPYYRVMGVISIARRAGVSDIQLATRPRLD